MALTAYQIKQRKDSLKPFVETYGLKFLNKLAKEKHNIESFYDLPGTQLENLKTRLKKPEVKAFIKKNKSYPTDFEARSLGAEFGEGRIEMRRVKESLVADLKGGRVDITPQSLAAKYGITVEELKKQAKALEKNIWNKRMGVPETELKWLVDEGNNLDNTLNNLYKGKIVVYQKDKVRELFYDAFGNPKNKGTPLYQPEKWKAIRKNLNTYFKIKQAVTDKYPNLNFELDHPLAKSTLRKYLEAKPEELVRVNPMTKQLNRGFKKVLDDRYGAAIKEKNIVKLNAIDKIAKDLNVSFGKVNQDFKTFDYGPASKSFENLNMGEEIGKALTQQQDLSKNFGKYAKANSARFLEAGFSENAYKKLVEKGVPDVGLKQESLKRLVVQLGKTNADNICDLVAMKAANGGRIGFAKGGNCATQIADEFDANPKKFAQEVNKTEGLAPKLKNAATRFLQGFKTSGSLRGKVALGAGAVIGGGGAAALVRQFRSDDKSTYLTNDRQMEGMIIADNIEKDLEDMGFILDNEGKIELAATGALSASMVKQVYNAARAGEAQLLEMPKELDKEARQLRKLRKAILYRNGRKVKRITETNQQLLRETDDRLRQLSDLAKDTKLRGQELKTIVDSSGNKVQKLVNTGELINPGSSGRIMSALGLRKGVLGLGLNAFMSPAIALPTAAMSLARDIKSGKSTEDTLTNPFTYLPTAFMKSGMKGLAKMGATRGLMGVAGLGLGSVAAAPVVGALSIAGGLATLGSMGYQGYKMFKDRNKTDEDFFN